AAPQDTMRIAVLRDAFTAELPLFTNIRPTGTRAPDELDPPTDRMSEDEIAVIRSTTSIAPVIVERAALVVDTAPIGIERAALVVDTAPIIVARAATPTVLDRAPTPTVLDRPPRFAKGTPTPPPATQLAEGTETRAPHSLYILPANPLSEL